MAPKRTLISGKSPELVWKLLHQPKNSRMLRSAIAKRGTNQAYADLRHILRRLEGLGYVVCLTPDLQTGRLYIRSDRVTEWQRSSSFLELVARVLRGSSRLSVLNALGPMNWNGVRGKTMATIRRDLRDKGPISFNEVNRATKALEQMGLVECVGRVPSSSRRLIALTKEGRAVAEIIHQLHRPLHSEKSLSPTP